jgi:hypothetical protein
VPSNFTFLTCLHFRNSRPQSPAWVEASDRAGRPLGYPNPCLLHRPGVLRRLQERNCSRQPHSSSGLSHIITTCLKMMTYFVSSNSVIILVHTPSVYSPARRTPNSRLAKTSVHTLFSIFLVPHLTFMCQCRRQLDRSRRQRFGIHLLCLTL